MLSPASKCSELRTKYKLKRRATPDANEHQKCERERAADRRTNHRVIVKDEREADRSNRRGDEAQMACVGWRVLFRAEDCFVASLDDIVQTLLDAFNVSVSSIQIQL